MSSKTLVSKTYSISHHKWGAGGKEQSEKTESKGLITIVATPISPISSSTLSFIPKNNIPF